MTEVRLSVDQQRELLGLVPAAVAVVHGPEHVFAFANDLYLTLIGRNDIVGRPCRDALPEIESQGFIDLLDEVYVSGAPFVAEEAAAQLDRGGTGELSTIFVNFAFLPILDDADTVTGILIHAVEVTELVEARENARALAQTLETVFDQMPAGAVIADRSGRLTMGNQVWRDFFGMPPEHAGSMESWAIFRGHRADGREYEPEEYPLARSITSGEVVTAEPIAFTRPGEGRKIIEVSSAPIRDATGSIVSGVATFFDVTAQQWATDLLADQNRVLELMASGAPLADTLAELVLLVEARAPDLRASVLLLDLDRKHLLHGAAPSLPDEYNAAIDGIEIGPSVGSCGTAAYTGERVVVTDIATDPLWADFRDLALPFGLRACWSTPILSPTGEVLGTFAVYYAEPGAPRPEELELVALVTRTAALAIARQNLERERERNYRVVRTLYRIGRAVSSRLDLHDIVQVVTNEATEVTGAAFGAFFYNVLREDGEAYTLYTLAGVPRSAFEQFPMPRNTQIFDPTFRGDATIRLDDVTQDPRYGQNAPYHGMPQGHLPVRSYLAAPVVEPDGSVLGGLFFGHPEPGRFTEEHEEILGGIAAQAAVAIVNSRLYEAEQRARTEAEQRAQAAFSLEHIDDGVALVDLEGRIQVWNRAAATLTGVDAEEAAGRRVEEIIGGWDAVGSQLRGRSPDGGHTIPVEMRGREAWLSITGTEFDGGLVYSFRDVTEERRLEEIRNELIATVSHELRTPVTAVYGAAVTLERPEVKRNPALAEPLFTILKSESERLVALVEEILLASNLGAGMVPFASEGIDAREAVLEAAAGFEAKGAHITVSAEPVTVAGDRQRLRQAIDNLIDNALKYGGADNPVEVRVRRAGETVRLEVADLGPGVPPTDRRRIFEKFVRLDPQMQHGVDGTGLGLYISNELVSRMGGRIVVEDREDGRRGAVFAILLRAA